MTHKHFGTWLTVNRRCNLRCGWCYARDTDYKSKDMSLDLAEKLINFFKELAVTQTVVLGGEPTVYPHLLQVLRMLILICIPCLK